MSSTLAAVHTVDRARASRPLRAIAALLALCVGCGEEQLALDLRVVSPSGSDPLDGVEVQRLFVYAGHGEDATTPIEVPVEDGTFDVAIPLGPLDERLHLELALVGVTERLVGALPPFTAAEAGFAATVVVGPAGRCLPLAGVELPAAATRLGAARVGTFGLLIGGDEGSGPSRRAAYVDLLKPGGGPLESAPAPLGPTRAAAVTRQIAFVLPTQSAPFFYDLGAADARILPAEVHAGAGAEAGLAADEERGVAVVGGRTAAGATAEISFIGLDGKTTSASLVRPRAAPAVALEGERLWIAGGEGEGADSLELGSIGASTVLALELADGPRLGGILFVSDAGDEALLIGGVDELGTLRADTLHIQGCPDVCAVSAGPAWAAAREGVTPLVEERLLAGGTNGRLERVEFGPSGPSFVDVAALDVARSHPGVLPLAAGVVIVVGGDDGAGPRRDAEICFPLTSP